MYHSDKRLLISKGYCFAREDNYSLKKKHTSCWKTENHSSIALLQIFKLVHIFVMSGLYVCLNIANIYEY